jgi:hypothetical protein
MWSRFCYSKPRKASRWTKLAGEQAQSRDSGRAPSSAKTRWHNSVYECARPVEEQGELPVVWRREWRLVSKQEPDLFTFTINGTGKSANEVKVG